MVALADDVVVDANEFEDAARSALEAADAAAAEALARTAVARYTGDLLPDDAYADWAVVRRESLRRLFLAAVDLVAGASERRGDVEDALRHLERGIEMDPMDDERYVRAAGLLADMGRRSAAAALLTRADQALDEMGVLRSPAHRELVKRLGL